MKLLKVLSKVNQIEKIAFLKILDKYSEELREKNPKIDRILSESDNVLKKVGDSNIVELFYLLRSKYTDHLDCGLRYSNYELDISLLTSSDLLQIQEGFKESAMKEFPVRLITKGGALNGERIVKAMNR